MGLDHRLRGEHPALDDRALLVPLRRLQVMTAATGLTGALTTAGALALQTDPGFVRQVLQTRTWGLEEIGDARVAEAMVGPATPVLSAVGVLLAASLLVVGASRLIGATRWIGSLLALLGLLSAASWAVDGQAILAAGAPLVLVGCLATAVFCIAWLLTAHSRPVRDAFNG